MNDLAKYLVQMQVIYYSCKLREPFQANQIGKPFNGMCRISTSRPGVRDFVTEVVKLLP